MFPGLTVPEHRQTATKRIAAYCACVSVLFLAAVLFGFHRGLQASKKIPAGRRISAVPAGIRPKLAASYGKLPLGFEANQGQTDPQVKFLSRGRGYSLFLTGDAAVLTLKKPSAVSYQLSAGRISRLESSNPLVGSGQLSAFAGQLQRTTDHGPRTTGSVLRMKLVGANTKATVTGAEELPGKSDYFIGNDPKKWRTNVPNYAKVRYRDVYSGVDLVYYGNQGGQLEYDFVVAPGADPDQIKLSFAGADGMRVDAVSGDLVLKVGDDEVRFQKPAVYQPAVAAVYERRLQSSPNSPLVAAVYDRRWRSQSAAPAELDGAFVLASNNEVGFRVAGYDPERALVIDPVLSYSTYLSGNSNDFGIGIAVDTAGNAYVTGYTESTDFPTANPLQPTNQGNYDAFVAKLIPAGDALVYSTYLGGSSFDQGTGIAADAAGNAYVIGFTQSTDFPTANPLQPNCSACASGGNNAFVAKLNPTGSVLEYSTYLGGSSYDYGFGIAVDVAGNAYVTGSTCSTDFPTANPLQTSFAGACVNVDLANDFPDVSYSWSWVDYAGDAFVAKLNPTGSALVYSTYLGGSGSDQGRSVVVDSAGSAYVTGFTYSVDFPTASPFQPFCGACGAGGSNAFVAKLNPAGSALVYSTYLGGSNNDFGNAIAVDAAGNADVTGSTYSTDFPTVNPLQPNCPPCGAGGSNAFVAKLNPTGSALVYSTYLGSDYTGIEKYVAVGYGIGVDSAGDAYVMGTSSWGGFPTANPLPSSFGGDCPPNGGGDVFVAKLNPAGGALVYSTCLGGGLGSQGYGMALDAAGNAYLTGSTAASNFPTVNPLQTYNGDLTTAFVAKISTAISFSPASLAFSSQNVGTASAPQTVTVVNTGTASFTVSTVTIGGANASDFATSADTCTGATVTSNGTCTVNVTFTPSAMGSLSASLIFTDDAPDSPQTVSLTGVATGPVAGISNTSLTFGDQSLGTTSASQPIILTNTGNAALTITSIVTSANFGQINNCGGSVAASDSCRIDVTFSPTMAGPLTGTLTITDNGNGVAASTQTVTLSGSGTGPAMSLSAPGLSLGSQPMSTTSAAQAETVTNTGTANLTISTVTIGGTNASDFANSADTCTGATVMPNGTCTVSVTFTPSAVGSRSASLSFTDNAFNSPQTVTLTGTGMGPAVSLSSSSLTFSAQIVGTSSSAQTVTLTNTGNASLTFTAIGVTGPFAIASSGTTCSTSTAITAGAACTVAVTFTPTAAGTASGNLSFADNANGSPQTVGLTGTGQDFSLAAASGSPTSATVAPGSSASYTLSVVGESGFNQSVNFTCSGAPSEATCTVSPSTMTPGSSASSITVSVTTTAPSVSAPRSRPLPPVPPLSPGLRGLLMLALVLALMAWAIRRRNRPGVSRWKSTMVLLASGLLLTLALAGCGGGGASVTHNTGTPAGTYTLTVTGSTGSGSATLNHSVTLTLTVN